MSIDDLTLTDLTIVKTQMLRLKFIVTPYVNDFVYGS
jgi:hypothetical protein